MLKYGDILISGVEGSNRYRPGDYQYNQFEMWLNVISLVPRLYINRLKYGRSLDIFVTHAPPKGIHDGRDVCHTGFSCFLKLIERYKPQYFIHGHTHMSYGYSRERVTEVNKTKVVNADGYYIFEIQPSPRRRGKKKEELLK